jgi:exopolyphosphatase / guanosine-5'-triphosphate,3'-diphosphate pyrophosphatase
MVESKFLAGIDIGSNTIKLLLLRLEKDQVVWRNEYIRTTRLGALDANNNLNENSFSLSLAVIDEFCKMASLMGARLSRIIATSAVRDASNSNDFIKSIGKISTIPVEILSGQDEAKYSFNGAKRLTEFFAGLLVIDVGGASTEVIWENSDNTITAVSVNVGAVRMKKNNWDKKQLNEQLCIKLQSIKTVDAAVGVGGTITTVAGLIAGTKKFDRNILEGMVLEKSQLDKLYKTLEPLTIKERCNFSPLLSKRGEIIEQGLLIWINLMEILQLQKIIVSTGGVLDGAIADML